MLIYSLFKRKISSFKTVVSSSGTSSYTINRIVGEKLYFTRQGKEESESINLQELYNFYENETNYTTAIARNYISSRVYSPAIALLKELERTEHDKSGLSLQKILDWWMNSTAKQKKHRIAYGLSIIFLILTIVLAYQEESTPNYNFKQYDKCIFIKDIIGGINEECSKKIYNYSVNQDQLGILEMINNGQAYGAFVGDKCMFIRNKGLLGIEVFLYNRQVNVIIPKDVIKPM